MLKCTMKWVKRAQCCSTISSLPCIIFTFMISFHRNLFLLCSISIKWLFFCAQTCVCVCVLCLIDFSWNWGKRTDALFVFSTWVDLKDECRSTEIMSRRLPILVILIGLLYSVYYIPFCRPSALFIPVIYIYDTRNIRWADPKTKGSHNDRNTVLLLINSISIPTESRPMLDKTDKKTAQSGAVARRMEKERPKISVDMFNFEQHENKFVCFYLEQNVNKVHIKRIQLAYFTVSSAQSVRKHRRN